MIYGRGGIRTEQELARWKRLAAGAADTEALLAEVAAIDPARVADLERLRRRWPADLLATALELVRARRKARRKFPEADHLLADLAGVEQATSRLVADHKARRMAALGRGPVHDLCCGIGGDAMSLAAVAEVVAWDIDPLRAWMTAGNAGCPGRCADVEDLALRGAVVHVDPERRAGTGPARRHWRYEDYRPGPAALERLLAACPDAAVKLGPGVRLAALPDPASREIEFINEGGTLVQAVMWCGHLARRPGARTATRLPDGVSFTGQPEPGSGRYARRFGSHLVTVDPAVERADLTAAVCRGLPVRAVHPGLGILTAEQPLENPWLRCFTVLEQMPWRIGRLRAALADLGAGAVTVRTRGRAVDAGAAAALRGAGSRPLTVFGLRLGRRVIGLITE